MMSNSLFTSSSKVIWIPVTAVCAIFISACGSYDPDSPEYWIDNALQQYHEVLMKRPYAAPSAYVEIARCDNRYCKYSEGYGHFIYLGNDVEIPMVNRTFLADQIKRSNPSREWLSYIDNSQKPEIQDRTDFQPGYSSLLGALRRMELSGLFNEQELQNYEYEIVDTLKAEDDPTNSKLKISFSSENELYHGTAFLSLETSRFKRVVLEAAPIYAQPLYGWQNADGEIRFDTDESGDYHLKFIQFEYTKDNLTHTVALKSEAPVHMFDEITDDTYSALYQNSLNPIIYYQGQEQNHQSSSFDHLNMEKIRQDLVDEKSLHQQFIANAGSPYLTVTLSSGDEYQPTGRRDSYFLVEDIREKLKGD